MVEMFPRPICDPLPQSYFLTTFLTTVFISEPLNASHVSAIVSFGGDKISKGSMLTHPLYVLRKLIRYCWHKKCQRCRCTSRRIYIRSSPSLTQTHVLLDSVHCMLSFWPPRFDGCLSSVSLKPLTGNKSFEILTLIGPNYPTLNNVKGIFLPSYSLPVGLSYLCVYFFFSWYVYINVFM